MRILHQDAVALRLPTLALRCRAILLAAEEMDALRGRLGPGLPG